MVVFESTASTNDVAAEYARNPDNHGLVVLAEHQTAGRGRGGNRWLAGKGESLLCSIVLTRCDLRPELLSLTVAVAVAEAIGPMARIKWPNDIVLAGRKVAGILVESKAFDGHTAYVVGIGINCHQKARWLPGGAAIDGHEHRHGDRQRGGPVPVGQKLLTCVEGWLDVAGQDPGRVVDRWGQLSVQVGHRLTVVYNSRRFSGTCVGVDPQRGPDPPTGPWRPADVRRRPHPHGQRPLIATHSRT